MSRMHWHRLKQALSFQRWIQLAALVLFNGYAKGFASGQIFAGPSKAVCVPVLNCYSCPGALGACPIGALQTVVGRGTVPFYVLGTLMLFGTILGRAVCGLLCPFGLVQDLLHKVPLRKRSLPARLDRVLRWLKYVVLALLVILLPALIAAQKGMASPFFCEWLCPAGTLGGALPLMAANPAMRALAGALFSWKFAVLVLIVVAAMLIPRPFCRYLCPLGAFYSLFNRVSFYGLSLNTERCVDCGRCAQVCPMGVDTRQNTNSPECIRCGKCQSACPTQAIHQGFCHGAQENAPGRSSQQSPKP